MEEDKKLLNYNLTLLHCVGYNVLRKPNFFRKLLRAIYLICTVKLYVLASLGAYYVDDKLTVLNPLLECFCGATQLLMKAYTFTKFKNELKYLLEATDQFWEVKDVDDRTVKVTRSTFRLIKTSIYMLTLGAVLLLALYAIVALITGKTAFIAYVNDKYYLTTNVVFCTELIFMGGSVFIAVGFDGTFVYLCYKCITQMQILKYKFENLMDNNDQIAELNKCIKHHGFLLKYIKQMTEVYNEYFLVQYMVALFSYAIEMIPFVLGGSTIKELIRSLCYVFMVLVQFVGCNCYMAQQLTNNAIELEKAIYNAKWYEGNVKIAKTLIVVLNVSQRPIVLKAGGMANIDLAVLQELFRASFSMIMFLTTMQSQ